MSLHYANVFILIESRSKNHYAENMRRIRQIQRTSKQKENDTHQPVKALWKSEKYSTVQSKIKGDIEVIT